MSSHLCENLIIGMGNPLLDIQSKVHESFLSRFKDMVDEYGPQVEYIAGGSTQNTMRVLQWMLDTKVPVSMYMGCIGDDKYGKILATKAKEAGINTIYQINPDFPTGTCAVCIHGHNRSLCANLSAAEKFTIDHIDKYWSIIERARFYYSAGFFLTVCPEAMLRVAQHAAAQNKPYCMNLSAPFLVQFFKEPMMKVFPYVDILFGNDDEMKPFAKEHNLEATSIEEIASAIANMPKINNKRQRIVVITQGKNPVIVAEGSKITKYPVALIPDDKIVDTNGAGDAFVGGFLSRFIVESYSIEKCVKAGIWVAQQIIQTSGCSLPQSCSYLD